MKKHFIGLTAVVIAVVTFAFTAPPKMNFTDYVWYPVKTNVHIACDQLPSVITLSQLVLDDSRYISTGNFATDIADVVFTTPASAAPNFDCDQVQQEFCAVGFLKPSSGSTGFTVDANGKWVPVLAQNPPVIKVCRTPEQ